MIHRGDNECVACRAWRHSMLTICWIVLWALAVAAFLLWQVAGG